MVSSTERDAEFSDFMSDASPRLLRYAYLITRSHDDAQELVQQALVKLYTHWDKVNDRAALEGYTKRIITREHISWWRRVGQREHATDELDEPSVHNPDVESRDSMWQLLGTLGKRQRTALVLRYYEDLSELEIAEIMGCSIGTVKSQLSRGLANLRNNSSAADWEV